MKKNKTFFTICEGLAFGEDVRTVISMLQISQMLGYYCLSTYS